MVWFPSSQRQDSLGYVRSRLIIIRYVPTLVYAATSEQTRPPPPRYVYLFYSWAERDFLYFSFLPLVYDILGNMYIYLYTRTDLH